MANALSAGKGGYRVGNTNSPGNTRWKELVMTHFAHARLRAFTDTVRAPGFRAGATVACAALGIILVLAFAPSARAQNPYHSTPVAQGEYLCSMERDQGYFGGIRYITVDSNWSVADGVSVHPTAGGLEEMRHHDGSFSYFVRQGWVHTDEALCRPVPPGEPHLSVTVLNEQEFTSGL